MAAAPECTGPCIVELRHIRARDLDCLLNEEIATWKRTLDWDFQASAGLVRQFVDMQLLSGFGLLHEGRVIGYSYTVSEDHKGLVGDLYIQEAFASVENEGRLLTGVVESLIKTPMVRRIESQLMMLRNASRLAFPHWRYLRTYNRDFMEMALDGVDHLPPGSAARWCTIDNWTEKRHDEAGALIANAYQGHVDSQINDQYRTTAGARKFLMNVVQYPGCGSFFEPGSFVAIDRNSRRLCGMCLSSLVSSGVGHITQVCVSQAVRGQGVGYELMRRALQAMARYDCHKASLAVTASNDEAIHVYKRMGFHKVRQFAAHVWDGF